MINRELSRFSLVFIGAFFLLSWAYNQTNDTQIQYFIIDFGTVEPSAWLINNLPFLPHVTAEGNKLSSPAGALAIQHGCEGVEAMLVLIAAFIAVKISLQRRLVGMVLCVALLYVLNQLRIVLLFASAIHSEPLFDALHGFVSPVVMIMSGGAFFYFWTQRYQYSDAQ